MSPCLVSLRALLLLNVMNIESSSSDIQNIIQITTINPGTERINSLSELVKSMTAEPRFTGLSSVALLLRQADQAVKEARNGAQTLALDVAEVRETKRSLQARLEAGKEALCGESTLGNDLNTIHAIARQISRKRIETVVRHAALRLEAGVINETRRKCEERRDRIEAIFENIKERKQTFIGVIIPALSALRAEMESVYASLAPRQRVVLEHLASAEALVEPETGEITALWTKEEIRLIGKLSEEEYSDKTNDVNYGRNGEKNGPKLEMIIKRAHITEYEAEQLTLEFRSTVAEVENSGGTSGESQRLGKCTWQ